MYEFDGEDTAKCTCCSERRAQTRLCMCVRSVSTPECFKAGVIRQVFTRKCFDLPKKQVMSTSESEGSCKRPRPCFYEARVGYQDIGSLPFDMSAKRVKLCFQDPPDPVDPYVRGPNPSPGCYKLLGCFCTSCRRSIAPSRKAVHTTVAYLLWGGLVEARSTAGTWEALSSVSRFSSCTCARPGRLRKRYGKSQQCDFSTGHGK